MHEPVPEQGNFPNVDGDAGRGMEAKYEESQHARGCRRGAALLSLPS
jgi:hypothetical protein